jgi:tRNA(Ile)-lysidine synthase
VAIPGEIDAPAFGLRLRIAFRDEVRSAAQASGPPNGRTSPTGKTAILRNWKPGDRVRLRHSAGPRKVKEVLERLRVTGTDRAVWPVLEIGGQIVWMRGVELEPDSELLILADFSGAAGAESQARTSAEDQ